MRWIESTVAGAWVHGLSLNESHRLVDQWQWTAVATGDGEAVRLASVVDASKLRCSSGEDEGTKGGGGLRRSFWDG
jgi:hypothetical protein